EKRNPRAFPLPQGCATTPSQNWPPRRHLLPASTSPSTADTTGTMAGHGDTAFPLPHSFRPRIGVSTLEQRRPSLLRIEPPRHHLLPDLTSPATPSRVGATASGHDAVAPLPLTIFLLRWHRRC
ncbi:hypothetical protein V8G54_018036, partial [Vigna mungo]